MKDKVRNILHSVLDCDFDESVSQDNCDEWDSMNQINIVIELQSEFGFKIPVEDIEKLISYESIVSYLMARESQ